MGNHKSISHDTFPEQGSMLGKRVKVFFLSDTTKTIDGEIVRDDMEDPWVTIIHLVDGRLVLSTECQYQDSHFREQE